jgi:NADPH-dependent curcumin reductase CurA
MKRRYRLITVLIVLLFAIVLIIAKNGLFAQEETPTEQFCNDSIQEYLIEYNVSAVGIGVIEDGELGRVKVYGELKKGTPAPDNAIFNVAINYKTTPHMTKAIAAACPDGVDVYFDNVGGAISDAVMVHINKFARIVVCGAISIYNETSLPQSMSVQPLLIRNSALMQGFIVSNYQFKFREAMIELSRWLAEDKLKYTETIVEGFDQIPQAFIDLFDGSNKGKMVVKI